MKALVYHGPSQKSWEEKPKPLLRPATDAIVKILKTTICGTDLHIATLLTAQFYTPAEIIMIDQDDNWLQVAKTFGATHIINNAAQNDIQEINTITNNIGVDVSIEAVGILKRLSFAKQQLFRDGISPI